MWNCLCRSTTPIEATTLQRPPSPISEVVSTLQEATPSIRPTSAATPRPRVMHNPIYEPLPSTVQKYLPEYFKFRILIIGKRCSGKPSLIKAVFKVDITAAPERPLGATDINFEYSPEDNRYLIVHECSGLESQAGDSQKIRDFISHRTDMCHSHSERLHAVWVCVPASDAIAGELGEGAEEILGVGTVPVILVFTKFDMVVSEVRFDISLGDAQLHEPPSPRARTLAMYEDSYRRLFHKDPVDVPAEIVSKEPRYANLIEKLADTTDRSIMGSRGPSAGFGAQGEKPRVSPIPLAWSAALRVSQIIVVNTSIEVGRHGYWHDLWSRVDFTGRTLKECVNVIHLELVEIWNPNDKNRYLSSDGFKAKMSHLVKDLLGNPKKNDLGGFTSMRSDPYPAGVEVGFADWVHGVYRGSSQKNIRCIMGYIVNLTVILDAIFRIPCADISPEDAVLVIDGHANSDHKNKIHRDIRGFVTQAYARRFSVPPKDLILDRIVDFIQQYCVPPAGNGCIRN